MSKTSLGKLAIGVIALSSAAVAHAEGGVMSKLKPSAVIVEGLPVGTHGSSWKTSSIFNASELYNIGATVEFPRFARVGPFELRYNLGVTYVDAKTGDNAQDANVNVSAALPLAQGDAIAVKDTEKQKTAPGAGFFIQPFATTINYGLTHKLQGLLKVGVGVISAKNDWKTLCGAASAQVGGLYKIRSNASIELGAKYIYALDDTARSISGLNVGMKYYV